MGLAFGCVCRNGSKAYIEVSGAPLEGSIVAATLKDGSSVIHECVSLTTNSFVVVVPLLAVEIIVSVNRNGNILKAAYSADKIKWLSRLNYRINPKTTGLLKDIELAVTERPLILTDKCIPIPAKNHIVVRGSVNVPEGVTFQASEVSVYNEKHEKLPVDMKLFGSSEKFGTSYCPVRLNDISFSVMLPESCKAVFFAINGTSYFDGIGPSFFQKRIQMYYQEISNADCDISYNDFYHDHKATRVTLSAQSSARLDYNPLFSVIVPLYNTPIPLFDEMVMSVLTQSYRHFELILVNASPDNRKLSVAIESMVMCDSRVKVVTLENNQGISKNTRQGINAASGEYVCFLDHDDTLEPNALFEYAYILNEDPSIDLLYCDEDKLLPNGAYAHPYFKPDFSPYLERETNYICHFLSARTSLVVQTGCDPIYDGAQDHRMILQLIRLKAKVKHVPKVLYHWRITPQSTASGISDAKPYADTAGRLAVEEHLREIGIMGEVRETVNACRFKVDYAINGCPKVSIIIPNKNNSEILSRCISSIIDKSTWQNFEIIIIENNSTDLDAFNLYETLQRQDERIKIITWENTFNYSAINNFGATKAEGEYYILLNNDTEVITPSWIEEMLGICQDPSIGAVGAKLLYPDGTVQHGGVFMSKHGPDHLSVDLPDEDFGYFAVTTSTREVSAVTAACLMVSKAHFELVRGLDEDFAVAYNDVDFCLKLRSMGLSNIYAPNAKLYHYESFSRGSENTNEKRIRFAKEFYRIFFKWPDIFTFGDPFMNPNLDPDSAYFKLPQED